MLRDAGQRCRQLGGIRQLGGVRQPCKELSRGCWKRHRVRVEGALVEMRSLDSG